MTKKKKLFLHIGRHKTGTTSLQKFLAQNTDMLSKRGILYPETGRQTRQGALDTAHHNFSSVLRYKSPQEIEDLFNKLDEEATDYDTILLSSEDFQNQKDFSRLAEIFVSYELTVVCYLREGLSYGLSGFAQRIHFSSEIFNIRQYMERQNIRLSGFIRQWDRLSDVSIFRLYERDKLKNRDIVEDFLDVLKLDDVEDTSVVRDSNPSLSGNLLGLKMLLNLIGQDMLASYSAFEAAAQLDPNFQGKIYISDRVAEELRGLNDYNAVLKSMFPDMSEPSFETGSKVFDLSRWDSDMDLISTIPEFAFAKTIRLSGLARLLSAHGVYADLGEADFLTPKMIDAIKLPETSQHQQVVERAMNSANDAMVARKARANAESAAVVAKKDSQKAQQKLKGMASELRTLTKKFRRDKIDLAKQLALVIKERDAARIELKSQSQLAQTQTKKSLEQFKDRIDAGVKERESLLVNLNSAREDRDKYKSQIKSLTDERTSKLAARDEVIKKQQAEIAEKNQQLKTQLKAIKDNGKTHNQEMAKLRDNREKALTARDELIERLREERDARGEVVKQRDKDIKRLKTALQNSTATVPQVTQTGEGRV